MESTQKNKSNKVFHEIIIIVCLTIIFVAVFFDLKKINKRKDFKTTNAICISREFSRVVQGDDSSTTYYNCKLQYFVNYDTYEIEVESARIKRNESVTIKYNPENPNEAYLEPNYLLNIITLVLLVVFILGSIYELKFKKDNKPENSEIIKNDKSTIKIVKTKSGQVYENEERDFDEIIVQNNNFDKVYVEPHYSNFYNSKHIEFKCSTSNKEFYMKINLENSVDFDIDEFVNNKEKIKSMLNKCYGLFSDKIEADIKEQIVNYLAESTYKDIDSFCDENSQDYISLEKYNKLLMDKGKIINYQFYFEENGMFIDFYVGFDPGIDELGDLFIEANFNENIKMIDIHFLD